MSPHWWDADVHVCIKQQCSLPVWASLKVLQRSMDSQENVTQCLLSSLNSAFKRLIWECLCEIFQSFKMPNSPLLKHTLLIHPKQKIYFFSNQNEFKLKLIQLSHASVHLSFSLTLKGIWWDAGELSTNHHYRVSELMSHDSWVK